VCTQAERGLRLHIVTFPHLSAHRRQHYPTLSRSHSTNKCVLYTHYFIYAHRYLHQATSFPWSACIIPSFLSSLSRALGEPSAHPGVASWLRGFVAPHLPSCLLRWHDLLLLSPLTSPRTPATLSNESILDCPPACLHLFYCTVLLLLQLKM
jgi:hypothetical protein